MDHRLTEPHSVIGWRETPSEKPSKEAHEEKKKKKKSHGEKRKWATGRVLMWVGRHFFFKAGPTHALNSLGLPLFFFLISLVFFFFFKKGKAACVGN